MHPALGTEMKPCEVHVTTASVISNTFYPPRTEEEMKLSDQTETKVCLVRLETIAKYGIRARHWIKQQPSC